MITIPDTLLVEDVLLRMKPESPDEAIDRVAALLKEDERVTDWAAFNKALRANPPCRIDDEVEFGICIPHARTGSVNEMVMSAARLDPGIVFPDCSKPVRYLFCIGVPRAMASDYLRIAGALMRIFKDPASERELRATSTPGEFVSVLSRLEHKV